MSKQTTTTSLYALGSCKIIYAISRRNASVACCAATSARASAGRCANPARRGGASSRSAPTKSANPGKILYHKKSNGCLEIKVCMYMARLKSVVYDRKLFRCFFGRTVRPKVLPKLFGQKFEIFNRTEPSAEPSQHFYINRVYVEVQYCSRDLDMSGND